MTKEVVDYFLEDSLEIHMDDHGYTYFHAACMTGNVAAVNLFFSQGVDVHLDTYMCSPLYVAARYRHVELVQILLEHGANPNQKNLDHSTPLHALARSRYPCECLRLFHFCDFKKPANKIIDMFIKKGAKIEACNQWGDTPLQLSVARFDVEFTRSLSKHGASLKNLNEL
ncbi:hypothetical protein TKK_0010358 [Trichogramma kaykai]